jgi:hypothetical protein
MASSGQFDQPPQDGIPPPVRLNAKGRPRSDNPNMQNCGNEVRNTYQKASKFAKQEEILRYLLTGHTLKECSVLTALSHVTVCHYVNEPEFLGRLKALSTEVYKQIDDQLIKTKATITQRIDQLSEKALDTLERLMDSEKEGIVLKAADSVLDRNEKSARNKKVESAHKFAFFDPNTLIHAASVATELAEFNGSVIEGETGDNGESGPQSDNATSE